MDRGFSGLFIGAIFGMLFVLINAHEPLNATIGLVLRVLAVVAFAGLGVFILLANRQATPPGDTSRKYYNGRFWIVVAGEVVLFVIGIAVLRALSAPEEANVAWIALVVGLHLIAFLAVWEERSIAVPGAILMILGVVGLAMSTTSTVEWTPFVSGVLSGITLLAFSFGWAVHERIKQNPQDGAHPVKPSSL